MTRGRLAGTALALVLALAPTGCVLEREGLDRAALLDPAYCQNCHPDHYREWASSMHAYASDDPVFVALNARGQRETGGALGDFCVQCHAPMAVRAGATRDGLNLAELPRHLKGVTCYFCHTVEAVEGTHNNPLRLADDGVMRGGLRDPMPTPAHASAYSPLMDRRARASSDLCGACHDVVTPSGLHLERTFAEWGESVFATDGRAALGCNQCHMPGRAGLAAAVPGAPTRRIYEHAWPGIDLPLSVWPDIELQRELIQRDLDPSISTELCVLPTPGGTLVEVTLDNLSSGHAWPSGVTHARRAWVELIAWRDGEVVLERGVVRDGEAVRSLADDTWVMGSRIFGADDEEVHMSWEAVRMESELLSAAVTMDPTDPRYYHAQTRRWTVTGAAPERVTVRVRMRPIGLDLVDDLVASGDLDPAVRDRLPTHELPSSVREWRLEEGFRCK